jgi:N-acetylglucosaminyl-diphospho-decaprenol L-rhamnosyltransferase
MAREVSVVVPHYGAPEPTLALLRALAAQTGDVVLQVVVVDDCSPVPFPDRPGLHVVRRTANGGFGSAVNSGAAEAVHPLLLVLNSDVTIEPGFVAALLDAAEPWQPAVVSPRVLNARGEDEWVGRHFPTATQQAVEWLTPLARFRHRSELHRLVGHDVQARGRTAVVDWVIGAALLIPTAAFREVGGFDERFFMNAEEVDLQRRLLGRGVRSVVLASPSLVHEGGGSSDPLRRREWLVESRLRYADKWGGRRGLQASLTAATVANLAVNGVRRVAGRDLAPVEVAREELGMIWKGRP